MKINIDAVKYKIDKKVDFYKSLKIFLSLAF